MGGFIFIIFKYFSEAGFPAGDEEEEHAEAKQEDGQDVQEDAGEAETAEEEGEVREVAQEEEAASPLKCCQRGFILRKKWLLSNKEALFQFSRCESVCQVL